MYQLLRKVFETLRRYKLKMSGKKALIARSTVRYMGYKMAANGICVDDERIKVLQLIKAPKDLHQTRVLIRSVCLF